MTMLGNPALLLVKDQVPMTRKGMMGGYAYRRMQVAGTVDRYQDKPDKNIYSHVCEAGQYLMDGAGVTETVIHDNQPQAPTRINASRGTNRMSHRGRRTA